jgi:hypothetical protein
MKKRKTRASDVGEKVRSREMKGQRPNRETETVDKIYMDLPPSLHVTFLLLLRLITHMNILN